jgi:hypothetical protein
MFFGLRYVASHRLYELQQAVDCFFKHCLTADAFSVECFPEWFRPVIKNSWRLRKRFEKIAGKLRGQDEETRQNVYSVFRNNNRIKDLCTDPSCALESLDPGLADLYKEIKCLFKYLYDKTINTSVFIESLNGASIRDHYIKFRELNGPVCPFCGVADYPDVDSGTRAAYDHYLSRSQYPFAGVNFENLVPMCNTCNERPNKGSKDILFTSSKRDKRREAFYPYEGHDGIRLLISRKKKPTLKDRQGRWGVSLDPVSESDQAKVQTWDSVFRVSTRLEARLRGHNIYWFRYDILPNIEGAKCDEPTLRRALKRQVAILSDPEALHTRSGAALQKAFFDYLADNADKEEVESYCEIASTSYMAVAASSGASLLRDVLDNS